MRLEELNALVPEEAMNEILKCCGSTNWTRRMADERPFSSLDEVVTCADRVWWSLEPSDWLEAFRSHPKIGEKKAERQGSLDAQKWSEQEQAGTGKTTQETQAELSQLNQVYEQKFGYIYIVCATGKTSEEMLEILKRRMDNAPHIELRVAAAEQAKITELRLKKLLN